MSEAGKRYNNGKIRYDLVPTYSQKQYAKVLTMGAEKYGDRNWEKGLPWMKGCVASLERHLEAFKSGEDYDEESKLLHMAHVMTNASFIVEFYKTHPEFDDRPQHRLPVIGIDICDIFADFPTTDDKEFFLKTEPKLTPDDIPFVPDYLILSSPIKEEWFQEWLGINEFRYGKLIVTENARAKIKAIQDSGVKWFVDSDFNYFQEINKNGVCCFLFDSFDNEVHKIGHKRIYVLEDLIRN